MSIEVINQIELEQFSNNLDNYLDEGVEPTIAHIITSYEPALVVQAGMDLIIEELAKLLPDELIQLVEAKGVKSPTDGIITHLDPFTLVVDLRYPGNRCRLIILTLSTDKSHFLIH